MLEMKKTKRDQPSKVKTGGSTFKNPKIKQKKRFGN